MPPDSGSPTASGSGWASASGSEPGSGSESGSGSDDATAVGCGSSGAAGVSTRFAAGFGRILSRLVSFCPVRA